MEHTANIMNTNKGRIPSILWVFAMFRLRLIDDRDKLEAVAIRCINCKKETGLYLGDSTSHHWFDLDFDWIEVNFSTRDPDFYGKYFQIHDDTQDTNTFKLIQVEIGN